MQLIYETYYSRNLTEDELKYFGVKSVQLISTKPNWLDESTIAWQRSYSPEYRSVQSPLETETYVVGFSTNNCPVPRGSRIVMKLARRTGPSTVKFDMWVYTGGYTACPVEPTCSHEQELAWDADEVQKILENW